MKPFSESHALVWGGSGSGKTYYANKALHAPWQRGKRMPSIFLRNRRITYIEGTTWPASHHLGKGIAQDRHLDVHVQDTDDPYTVLERVWDLCEQLAEGVGHQDHGPKFVQVVVDEAHHYNDKSDDVDPLEYGAKEMGSRGVRLVAITQYPAQLSTPARNELSAEAIFRPGRWGRNHLKTSPVGYPDEEILEHVTSQPYAYVTFDPRTQTYHAQDPV